MATLFKNTEELLNKGRQQDTLNPAEGAGRSDSLSKPNNPELPGFKPPTGGRGFLGNASGETKPGGADTSGVNDQAIVNSYANIGETGKNLQSGAATIAGAEDANIKKADEELDTKFGTWRDAASTAADKQGVSDEDLNKAVNEGGSAYENVLKRLNTAWGGVDTFDPGVGAQDVSALEDPDKVEARRTNALNEKSGGQYTSGMANLDEALINSAGGYNFQNIFQNNQALKDKAAGLGGEAEAIAAGEGQQYDAETSRYQGILRTILDDIIKKNETQYADGGTAFDTATAANRQAIIDRQLAEVLSKGEGYYTPELIEAIKRGDYVTQAGAVNRSAENYYDQDEVDRLNRIATLLGLGTTYQVGTVPQGEQFTSLDTADWSRFISPEPPVEVVTFPSKNDGSSSEGISGVMNRPGSPPTLPGNIVPNPFPAGATPPLPPGSNPTAPAGQGGGTTPNPIASANTFVEKVVDGVNKGADTLGIPNTVAEHINPIKTGEQAAEATLGAINKLGDWFGTLGDDGSTSSGSSKATWSGPPGETDAGRENPYTLGTPNGNPVSDPNSSYTTGAAWGPGVRATAGIAGDEAAPTFQSLKEEKPSSPTYGSSRRNFFRKIYNSF